MSSNLTDLIQYHASQNPHKPAFIFEDQTVGYLELYDRVLLCAQGLSSLGIKKGDTFALYLRNCPEFIVLSMALSHLGAITVPINFLEKPDRVALILNDAKAVGILSSKEYMSSLEKAHSQVPTLRHVFLRDGDLGGTKSFSVLLEGGKKYSDRPAAGDSDLMMLLYTSGTTGQPKGVMLTHRNFIANVDQCLAAIKLDPVHDRMICLLPMFHSFSWTVCVLVPLRVGIPTLIIESILPFEPILKSIWKHHITLFVAVPQIYSALGLKIKGIKATLLRWLSPVRVCISGAAPLAPLVLANFEKAFGVELLEGYGLTECAPVAALNPVGKRKSSTVGRPLPGVVIEIRDEEGHPVEQGLPGEIFIKGDNVMLGYYNKPHETQEALTKDGWLKTGDVGKFDSDGYLLIVDRKKDLIIIKGLNVYPQEVEAAILKVESVLEVAVVGKMDPDTQEETIRAFVTAKQGMTIDKAQIFEVCRHELAPYKRPKEIHILDQMPKNALQKILKKDLRLLP